ncbi:transglycosylase domain-containing protein [Ancylobacter mangrovi]|uniref:transglycosylase domain-containing protein n=1 Tax=Ancylobacter mangrovi TaxID=2972472 RepID=UPI00216234F7|nr:penicillin-binding protein 1A [Ancylobacter mangrovi]MCS0503091.1 penicillin-binding protein 1A [Ancylobacter mangrovi]
MFAGRGNGERREPVLSTPGFRSELRLTSEDRPTLDSAPMARERGASRTGAAAKAGKGSGNGGGRAAGNRQGGSRAANGGGGRGTARPSGGGGGRGGRPRRGRFARLLYWGFVLCIWGGIGLAGLIAYEASQLPPIQNLAIPERPPTVTIKGVDGTTIATRGEMGGASVPLRALPPYLPQAFVAIEDRRFYSHFGLDPLGLARAMFVNITTGRLREGGSTLTQQLAKNLFLTQERTISRKIQELILSIWLETKYSKNQILELYVNRVYFGAGAYGVEAAAQRYFGKSARQLTLSESAMLAGLVKSPSALAPTHNLDGAQARAAIVLGAMEDADFISPEMEKTALAHPATLAKGRGPDSTGYAADWVMDRLKAAIGPIDHDLVVETTLDPSLEAVASDALKTTLDKDGKKYGVEQGAVVLMDTNGGVKALVGGKSYEESQFNRAVTAKRQPGSAFKPFVYLTALERGLTPETVREDAPIQIKGWKPENYSHKYRGPVELKTALAFSLNTVAVRLAMEVGPAEVIKTAHRLGITSKLEPNASIALGTSEVSVLELVGAYAPFANGGVGITPHVIERVRDASGKVIYSYDQPSRGMVMAPPHVAMMNRMMRETLLVGTARHADLPGWPAGGKTGTSQDYRDAWFVGYTGRFVAGVWLGNDDSSPTKRAGGSGLPVTIWSEVMKAAHKGLPVVQLPGTGTYQPGDLPPGDVSDEPMVTSEPQPSDGHKPATIDNWLLDKLFGRG